MEALVILALIALALAAAAPALYALRRRLAQPAELEIWRMLERRGPPERGQSRSFAMAVRRCALCTNVEQCRDWLAGRSAGSVDDFCPNARYLQKAARQ